MAQRRSGSPALRSSSPGNGYKALAWPYPLCVTSPLAERPRAPAAAAGEPVNPENATSRRGQVQGRVRPSAQPLLALRLSRPGQERLDREPEAAEVDDRRLPLDRPAPDDQLPAVGG